MSKSTSYKSVVVKEDPKTSLVEAGIHPLTLANGMRAVAVGHAYFPNHDRNIHKMFLQYLRDTKPAVVLLLGSMIDENAFKELTEQEDNYLHEYEDAPEVITARQSGGFEAQVLSLGKACGDYIKSFAEASGGTVIYIPSATHLSMGNEVRLIEAIQRKKKVLDAWSANHPDASELPSDPSVPLPKKLAQLLQIDNLPNITVKRFGAAVKVNNKTLFMIGDFRRRHAGDAAKVEWEQRALNIVRGFDGKVASGWMTTAKHTMPGLVLEFHEFHEVGYFWDPTRMGHFRDYDRRAPGFCSFVSVDGVLFGSAIPIIRGNDGRRSFIDDVDDCGFKVYTEDFPGALPHGEEITLMPPQAAAPESTPTPEAPAPTPAPKVARKPSAKKQATGKRSSSDKKHGGRRS
jgi:hypothetical protein